MYMRAQEIVERIGRGVLEALNTNQLFLGVEVDAFQNADIHPEYVTTVEVAKELTAPELYVSLETHMKELRKQARGLAWLEQGRPKGGYNHIDDILAPYKFGKKDSQRLDILIRPADDERPPILMAEAKLGVENLPGVLQDIDRVVRLLTMYHDLGLLDRHDVYAAVLFHSMEEGNDTGSASQKALNLLSGIESHLAKLRLTKSWLISQANVLTWGSKAEPVTGYRETMDDGSGYDAFAKESFSFAPGLVLLGNAADVSTAKF